MQEISQERTDVWPKRTFVQLLISDQGFNANRFCYIGNWEGRELARVRGGGGETGDNKPYQQDQEALKMFPRCLERQRGMVSREHWGESLPESVRMIKENKSWWACFRLSDSGEWHFPLSERLVQDRSWWANKMIEQKELFYKDRTSVPEPIFCSLVSSKPQALCLLKMRNKALLSAVGTLTYSCHVM